MNVGSKHVFDNVGATNSISASFRSLRRQQHAEFQSNATARDELVVDEQWLDS